MIHIVQHLFFNVAVGGKQAITISASRLVPMLVLVFVVEMSLSTSKYDLHHKSADTLALCTPSPHLVIDIGNVHHKAHVVLEIISQYPPQDIGADIVSRVAQVRIVIDRWSAGIPLDLLAVRI